MKMRLQGNSVRLRLSKKEVESLAKKGMVEEVIEFTPNPLVYLIHASRESSQIEASFRNGWVTVSVPWEKAKQWAANDELEMEGICRGISVLIEKDWGCVHEDAEENEDKFPPPAS
jgi:hypothetical protein